METEEKELKEQLATHSQVLADAVSQRVIDSVYTYNLENDSEKIKQACLCVLKFEERNKTSRKLFKAQSKIAKQSTRVQQLQNEIVKYPDDHDLIRKYWTEQNRLDKLQKRRNEISAEPLDCKAGCKFCNKIRNWLHI